MKTNEAGMEIIKTFEGFSSKVYRCPALVCTVGFGSTYGKDGKRITMKHPDVSKKEAEFLLHREVRHTEDAVRRLSKDRLNENQFSAVVSLGYNIGTGNLQSSTLMRMVRRGDIDEAADQFPRWKKANGRTLSGLVRRRAVERELFLS